MKIQRAILSLLIIVSFIHTSFTQSTFEIQILDETQPSENDYSLASFESIVEVSSGGFILAGVAGNQENRDMWVVRTNSEGIILWERKFGGTGIDTGQSIIEVSSGGFIITGWTQTSTFESLLWLVCIDDDGKHKWERSFGNVKTNGYCVIEKNHGGFAVVGNHGNDMWLVSTDAEGNQLWNKTFDTGFVEVAYSIIETDNGGFILAGEKMLVNPDGGIEDHDGYIVHTDEEGNLLRDMTLGGSPTDILYSVIEADEGSFVVSGYIDNYEDEFNKGDTWLMCFSTDGRYLWSSNFEGSGINIARSIIKVKTGGFAFVSQSSSLGVGFDIFLKKVDNLGVNLWNRTFDTGSNEIGNSIIEINDGGYAIAGTYGWYRNGWLVRTDSMGFLLWNKTYSMGSNVTDSDNKVRLMTAGVFVIVSILVLVIYNKRRH